MDSQGKLEHESRNLTDYMNDAEGMIKIYTNPALSKKKHPGNYFFFREHLLSMYLRIRKYSRNELVFIRQYLLSKINYDSKSTTHKEIVYSIIKNLNDNSGPYTKLVQIPIEDTYVKDSSKFQLAEIWAFDNSFIDEKCVWVEDKILLGAFLNSLMIKKVIASHIKGKLTNDQIDSYFADRYQKSKLITLLKYKKVKNHMYRFNALEDLLDGKSNSPE